MEHDERLRGASTWEQRLYDMITEHEHDEEEVITAYRNFVERTDSDAVRYLLGLIVDDEERHRRVPRLSNHRPVPAILPPPTMWLTPWATNTPPTAMRSTSSARSTACGSR